MTESQRLLVGRGLTELQAVFEVSGEVLSLLSKRPRECLKAMRTLADRFAKADSHTQSRILGDPGAELEQVMSVS